MDSLARECGENLSTDVIAVLTEFVRNNIDDMFGKFSTTISVQDKEKLWQECATAVSAVGFAPQ